MRAMRRKKSEYNRNRVRQGVRDEESGKKGETNHERRGEMKETRKETI